MAKLLPAVASGVVTLAILAASAWAAPAPKLKPAAPSVPAAPGATRQFNVNLGRIPAGSTANFVIMYNPSGPTAGLPVQENQQVWVPVAGKVGNVTLPQGSVLVGKLSRADNESGTFSFETLIVNNRIYPIQAVSAPIPGKLQADPTSLETPRDDKQLAKADIARRRAERTGGTIAGAAGYGGGLVRAFGGSWQAATGLGAAGGIAGLITANSGADAADARQEEILNKDIPTVMVATLSPLQNLPVQFNSDVDLAEPVGELPPGMQGATAAPVPNLPAQAPANYGVVPRRATTGGGFVQPGYPVAPYYGVPGYGMPGYGVPVVPAPVYIPRP